jgi:hypothetical protein|tara:strand:+ start:376 stop:507 length:132 start_codon:yes stop_codon:yes gene_type:complete
MTKSETIQLIEEKLNKVEYSKVYSYIIDERIWTTNVSANVMYV